MPTSAGRSSPVTTSTSVPPVSSVSKGRFPWAASLARSLVAWLISVTQCIARSSSPGLPSNDRNPPERPVGGSSHSIQEAEYRNDRVEECSQEVEPLFRRCFLERSNSPPSPLRREQPACPWSRAAQYTHRGILLSRRSRFGGQSPGV